jgi:ATP-binding cassette subfamily B multidrug efflux pump
MSAPEATDRVLVARWMAIAWSESPGALALICILSVANAALVVAFPWLWQYLVDALHDGTGSTGLSSLVGWMALVGVSQTALYVVLQGTRSIMNARISWRARRRVFDHLSRQPPSFFREWRSGDLVTRLSDDAGEKIAWFLCSGVFRTLEASLIVLACLAVMASLAPWLTLQVVLPLPLLMVGQALAQGALSRRYSAVQSAISEINDALTTTFSGIRVIQASRLQPGARRRFRAAIRRQQDAEIRTATVQQIVFLMYGYGWQLAVVALLLAGGQHVLDGRITLGQFVSFEGFVMTLVWPMFDVGMFVSKYKQTSVALRRLQEILDSPEAPEAEGALPSDTGLVVSEASAIAPDGATLLTELELTIPSGSTLAVVGQIGSGKTTLMELLAGQRPLSGGTLALGGTPLVTPWPAAIRRAVGHVPQDPVLITGSLEENLLLGREADDAAIQDALEISRFAQDLPDLPDGLKTRVGEQGVTLSGGQQQRLAIARALIGRPTILLLDDATAALDADTEASFWAGISTALPGVTIVTVTHRVSTIQRADEIIVLDGGRIVQRGAHADLLREGGEYRRLYGRLEASATLQS